MDARLNDTITLVRKEVILEFRQLFAFNGVLLYLVSTVFVCYLSFQGTIDIATWNALFWIIMLFVAINAVLKSFMQEHEGRLLYYYCLASPQSVITAKIIYNAGLMVILSFLGLFVFIGFMGNPIKNLGLFIVNMGFGVVGFASILSMVSAIASKSRNNFTLMGVLSFPLVLPLMLMLIRVSMAAINGYGFFERIGDILVIILLSLVTFVMSNLLFPYIWKE